MTNEYNILLQEKEKAEILLLQSKLSIHQYEEAVKRLIDCQKSTSGTMLSASHNSNSNSDDNSRGYMRSNGDIKVKEINIQVCLYTYTYII